MSPADRDFVLIVCGVLNAYRTFIRPFRWLSGLISCIFVIFGVRELARCELTSTGLVLIGLAGAMFVLEAFWGKFLLWGGSGTMLLCLACLMLIRGPAPLSPPWVVPVCIAFGAVTTVLCRAVRRARLNKRADLQDGTPVAAF